MKRKEKMLRAFEDSEWIQDLAFVGDISSYLNDLNLKMQGVTKLVTEIFLH